LITEFTEIAIAEGFEDLTLTVSTAANVRDGFSGILLRVTIEGTRLIDGLLAEKRKLGVVIKMPPDSLERHEQLKSIPMFEREAMVYRKYHPMLVQFQHDRSITEEADRFFLLCSSVTK
jgi:hypothetical protein